MLKRIRLSVLFIVFSLPLFAQISVNPQNEFYSDAASWYLKGYVDSLPQVKPYPAAVIKEILENIAERGDASDIQKAQAYLERYFNKVHIGISGRFDVKLKNVEEGGTDAPRGYKVGALGYGRLFAAGDNIFSDLISLGYDAGFVAANNNYSQNEILPVFENDAARNFIKNYSIGIKNADFLFDIHASASVGNKKIYGSFGFNKLGYGLYPDGDIILNPASYQILNGSFHYNGEIFRYSQIFALPAARSYANKNDYSALKFMSFHSFEARLFSQKLNLSFYESVVWGKNFSPSYLIPAPWFIIANVAGFNENVISGIALEWKMLPCIAVTASAAFDDLKLKQFFKLKMNNAAVRTAYKTGFVYSPYNSAVSIISLDYTLVTPYTCTSYNRFDDTYNFMDYTNFGMGMGTKLPPNSDKVSFNMRFKPFNRMKVSVETAFARHANPYEDFSDDEVLQIKDELYKVSTGGNIMSDSRGTDKALDFTGFLKQDHIMYITQAAFGISYEFIKRGAHSVELSGKYTFEYIKKDGVMEDMYTNISDLASVAAARKAWVNNLHDSYNHYFNCGIKIMF